MSEKIPFVVQIPIHANLVVIAKDAEAAKTEAETKIRNFLTNTPELSAFMRIVGASDTMVVGAGGKPGKASPPDEDDGEDEKPAKAKKKAVDDDDDEEPAPKKKAKIADDDDDEPPRRKKVDDDDDEPAPKKVGGIKVRK